MKLTNNTTPQARNYQCDKCKRIRCHKDMYMKIFVMIVGNREKNLENDNQM